MLTPRLPFQLPSLGSNIGSWQIEKEEKLDHGNFVEVPYL